MRVQLWWGLLAPGHSHDGELPLLGSVLPPHSDSLGGGEGRPGEGGEKGGEGTPAAEHKHTPLISVKGLKWDQIVGNPPFYCLTV